MKIIINKIEDLKFLEQAINMSVKSYNEGAFPAGAVIVSNGKMITSTVSTKFPKINFHSESKAIDISINKLNSQLRDCTLYASMEPCLMCLSRAYWAGIRRIVFAVKKELVPYNVCYESNIKSTEVIEKFNEKIELVHLRELQEKAMKTVNIWLENNNKSNK